MTVPLGRSREVEVEPGKRDIGEGDRGYAALRECGDAIPTTPEERAVAGGLHTL